MGPGRSALAACRRGATELAAWTRTLARRLPLAAVEFAYLRQERGLSQHTLAQRATLLLETVQAVESGRRLSTEHEFALLGTGLDLTAGRLAEILRPVVRHQASGIQAFG